MNKRCMRRVCPKKAPSCLLSPGKSHIAASHATIDGSRSHLTLSPFSTLSHRHNILWEKIIDIQMEFFYISPVRKQCLIKKWPEPRSQGKEKLIDISYILRTPKHIKYRAACVVKVKIVRAGAARAEGYCRLLRPCLYRTGQPQRLRFKWSPQTQVL